MDVKTLFENGRIPPRGLKATDAGDLMQKDATDAFMRMKNDAKKDGVELKLSQAYRECGQKGDYTERRCRGGFTQWCAWEKYKAGRGNLAANPTTSQGCKSKHGWGVAIDVSGSKAQRWIKNNGEKYGWWWAGGTFSQIENWHFEYDPARDTFKKGGKNTLAFLLLAFGIGALGVGFYLARKKK